MSRTDLEPTATITRVLDSAIKFEGPCAAESRPSVAVAQQQHPYNVLCGKVYKCLILSSRSDFIFSVKLKAPRIWGAFSFKRPMLKRC
jgi:hypothetical protein